MLTQRLSADASSHNSSDELIPAFDRLLLEFRALADSARMQGNYLEELARHYLLGEPQWADQVEEVWLWKDWPGRGSQPDTGIDLVAAMRGGGVMAVQVKFFSADHRVQKADIDSFLESLGREPFTEGLVIDTALSWSTNAQEALKNRSKPVRRVTLNHLRHTLIDWSTYELTRPHRAPEQFDRKQLRAHQHAAVSSVMSAFEADSISRGKLIMACGTGKTFTALKLAERWTRERAGGNSTILFAVPSLALLQQTLEEWSREHDPELPFTAFAVGSDERIGRVSTGDITSVRLEDLGAPATTDGGRLAALLEEHELDGGMTVVFSTYQSIDAVSKAQRLGAAAFDLIICDEAHRTTGVTLADEDSSHFVKIHDDEVVLGERRVYMTATPRIYSAEIKNTARAKDAELVSMDDESIYGPTLYRIGFGEAVDQGLLTDYKVLVLGVSEDQIATGFQKQLASDGHELQLTDVAKLIGCWNGLAKRQADSAENDFGADTAPMRRAVAFARDINTSKSVSQDFPALVDNYLSNSSNDDATDDLAVHCRHIDGTMNATERGALLDWLKAEQTGDRPVARILTNARCLSEGVDVPSLDAVLFLNPRKSQVDVVQAVGRVMRRAEGKQTGYIILPIAVPADVSPEAALGDNERYRVVWQVLQALRSHDERLDAQINQMGVSGKPPETVVVSMVDLRASKGEPSAFAGTTGESEEVEQPSGGFTSTVSVPLSGLGAHALEWRDAVYAKLVRTVGDRLYWDDWAKDIGEIAGRFITLVRAHIDAPETDATAFDAFVLELQRSVNGELDRAQAIELVAQHLITMPIFEAMFPGDTFSSNNPVSRTLATVVESLADNAAFEREREPLDDFYSKITARIRGLDDVTAKQRLLVTLYDRFFKQAFPSLSKRMGIVFTPVEVVDYVLRSADDVAQQVFGKNLSDEGVRLIDPFVGTGTFIARLFQIGLIQPSDLVRKFREELFANEIVLLSYYIAAVNIESVYRSACESAGIDPGEAGFPGISLADTMSARERDEVRRARLDGAEGMSANSARLEAQLRADIDVIVMNPPYSVGQKSANDGNQNQKYPALDKRIAETYALRSTGTRKAQIYDSYYRALRWATDRIGDRGIIAFVSNSGFIDDKTANGVRLTWAEEFSDIFIFNLRGNARPSGELRRREAGNVFGEGSRTGVAIAILVKDPTRRDAARLHYRDIGDYLTREEKLERIRDARSIGSGGFTQLIPNESGDWINQRDDSFTQYAPLGDRRGRANPANGAIFETYSPGVSTNRDAWVYRFGSSALRRSMQSMYSTLNALIEAGEAIVPNPRELSWSRRFAALVRRQRPVQFDPSVPVLAQYRPFVKQHLWLDAAVIESPGLSHALRPEFNNVAIAVNTRAADMPLMVNAVADLHLVGDTQVFQRWRWQPVEDSDGGWNFDGLGPDDVIVSGHRRIDNISDSALSDYRECYGSTTLTKDDIFYYVYALLHHPSYLERFAPDLKKLLPHIPKCSGFNEYTRIGRALAELHLRYEDLPPYPLEEQVALDAPMDLYMRYRIERLTWTARRARTGIKINEYVSLAGIPEQANDYTIGTRSPLEWVIDRYQRKLDGPSGIINDPNEWMREQQDPRYVVNLIGSLVTLSLETQRLVSELPPFEVAEQTSS